MAYQVAPTEFAHATAARAADPGETIGEGSRRDAASITRVLPLVEHADHQWEEG
jgi:hypothetical protein